MRAFDLLSLLNTDLHPGNAKIHLAGWNGIEEPIDVYVAGRFDDWQRWQKRRNFERRFAVSLISLPARDKWLFAGVHASCEPEWVAERGYWHYKSMVEDLRTNELNGRLVVEFSRPGRQSYLIAQNCVDQILVSEVFAKRLAIGRFPGYRKVNLSKAELDIVVGESMESWRTALANVAGVYLITDTASGKLYVGSATGEGGIWARWGSYAADGHGGNTELRALLKDGRERANHFRYSILEIADVHASREDLLGRECHWKDVLMTRRHGLNGN